MHRYKTEWYSIRLPVSTRDFDVSSCVMFWRLQKGPGASAASWGRSEVQEAIVGKRASWRRVGRSG